MKRIIVIAGAVLALLCSCAMTPTISAVHDESVPVEKSSLLIPGAGGEIIAYNGIPVKKMKGMLPGFLVPAGDTLLEWNAEYSEYGGYNTINVYQFKNVLTRHTFNPNKQYFFWRWYIMEHHEEERFSYRIFGVQVYEWDLGDKIGKGDIEPNSKHFVGFVPYSNMEKQKVLWGKGGPILK